MDTLIKANLNHAHEPAAHIKSALGFARVDKVIAPHLAKVPGLDAIVKDLVTHATAVGDAVQALGSAVNLDTSGAAVEARHLTTTPFNDTAIKSAIAKLRTALAVGPLIDKFDHLFTDPASQKGLKTLAEEKGVSGGVEDARGALKSINPGTIAVASHIRGLIATIQTHEAIANSPATKQSLVEIETELTAVLDTFSTDVLRLVAVFDKGIGATFR
jgi:hypothetical protein